MTQSLINPLLEDDISQIADETTKKICLCALVSARAALARGETAPSEFVSNELARQLNRILRGAL